MDLLSVYRDRITCVCFIGEGTGTTKSIAELIKWCSIIISFGLKTGIYTGRDGRPQKWMNCFDYAKTGRYIQESGPLTSKNTNQNFFKNSSNGWTDITEVFWS
jgi:anaerobic ribonucleoside-triphosphate reductase activating protein